LEQSYRENSVQICSFHFKKCGIARIESGISERVEASQRGALDGMKKAIDFSGVRDTQSYKNEGS
jgi:hypothetical protein